MRRRATATIAAVATLVCVTSTFGAPVARWPVTGHVYVPNEKLPPKGAKRGPLPAVGAIVEVRSGSRVIAQMQVKPNGSFSFELRPGNYRIVSSLRPPKVTSTKVCASRSVTVKQGGHVKLHMECSLF
jgi:hypothetical protein